MKKILLLCITSILISSCKREKEIMFVKSQSYKDAESIATKVLKTQGTCSCDPTLPATWPSSCAPRNLAITAYMGSLSSVTKTVTWSSSLVTPSSAAPQCNGSYISGTTTQIKLCYMNCTTITAELIGKPECLPCLGGGPICFQLTPATVGGKYVLQGGYGSDGGELLIELAISADPNITVKCTAGGTTFVAYGNF